MSAAASEGWRAAFLWCFQKAVFALLNHRSSGVLDSKQCVHCNLGQVLGEIDNVNRGFGDLPVRF